MKIKVVLDTNVLISATLWDGSAAQKVLFKLIKNNAIIYSSPDILSEFQKILKRDFDYCDEEIASITEKILCFLTLIEPKKKLSVVKEDPDDDKILECAVESLSEYILSYDKHLLKIKEYEKIKIIKPEEFMFDIQ